MGCLCLGEHWGKGAGELNSEMKAESVCCLVLILSRLSHALNMLSDRALPLCVVMSFS